MLLGGWRDIGFRALLLAAPLLMPGAVAALELPAAARLLSERILPLDSYDLPVEVFDGSAVPSRVFEGRVARRTWRIDGSSATTLQLLEPLRDQLRAAGYVVIFDCAARDCGGFDFRYGTDVAEAPQMHVDLGNYRFVSAIRGADEALSLLISRTGSSAYIQEIHVSAPSLDEEETAGTPPDTVPETEVTAPAATGDPLTDQLVTEGHVVLPDLDFGTGAGALGAGPFASLEKLAGFLQANPGYRIMLVGHTDSVGALEGNLTLSRQRAEAVRDRLLGVYGLDMNRVSAEGVGYLAPVASNFSAEGRDKNRRVEAVLLPAR